MSLKLPSAVSSLCEAARHSCLRFNLAWASAISLVAFATACAAQNTAVARKYASAVVRRCRPCYREDDALGPTYGAGSFHGATTASSGNWNDKPVCNQSRRRRRRLHPHRWRPCSLSAAHEFAASQPGA
jgi:hypothetical protein